MTLKVRKNKLKRFYFDFHYFMVKWLLSPVTKGLWQMKLWNVGVCVCGGGGEIEGSGAILRTFPTHRSEGTFRLASCAVFECQSVLSPPNNTWREGVCVCVCVCVRVRACVRAGNKLLIMQLSPAVCYFLRVSPKHFPQHLIPQHPHLVFFPQCERNS
jgi:hypothetical protein